MTTILLVVHLLLALALIGVVLMQRSEGGALGIGGGGMGSLFSSRGAANLLTRATAFLAVGFFATSIALTMLARQSQGPASVFDTVKPGTGGQAQPAESSGQGPSVLPELPAPSQPQVPVGQ
jgi:preprotein translocase subunit SecG